MVSRLCLAVEYASIIWHVRKFRNARRPLGFLVFINFAAAMIYLGITFRFTDGYSRVFYAWYIIAVAEVVLNIGISAFWNVLSFKRTHLIRRMSLLTLIILGEGVIVVCENVTVIVKNPASWSTSSEHQERGQG
jgi:low temperature requirement protein LtrA